MPMAPASARTPKSEVNDWCLFQTEGAQKAVYQTEGDDSKPPTYQCTLKLPDGRQFQSEGGYKKKKDAEQAAAEKAMQAIGRPNGDPECAAPTSPAEETAHGRWQLLKAHLEAALADKSVAHFSPLSPFFSTAALTGRPIPLAVLAQVDNRIATAIRGVHPQAETDPCEGLALLAAAVRACEGVQPTKDGLGVKFVCHYPHCANLHRRVLRTQPWPESLTTRARTEGHDPASSPPGCFRAVFLPQDNDQLPADVTLPKKPGGAYVEQIAEVLGLGGANRVLVSRSVGKSGSNLRIYSPLPPLPTAHVSDDGSFTFVPVSSGERNGCADCKEADLSENGTAVETGPAREQSNGHDCEMERVRLSGSGEENGRNGSDDRNERNERNERNKRAIGSDNRNGRNERNERNERNGSDYRNEWNERNERNERNGGERNGRNERNERASWVAGHAVYGDALVASVGTTYSSLGKLTWDDVTVRDWQNLVQSRHPRGMYLLSRGAPLAVTLPRTYPGSNRWEGKTPKTLLFDLGRPKCSGAGDTVPVYTLCKQGEGGSEKEPQSIEAAGGRLGLGTTQGGVESRKDSCSSEGGQGAEGSESSKLGSDIRSAECQGSLEPRTEAETLGSPESEGKDESGWEAEVEFAYGHQAMRASSGGRWESPGDAENAAALAGLHVVQKLFDARVLTRKAAKEQEKLGDPSNPEHDGTAIVDYKIVSQGGAVLEENRGFLVPRGTGAVVPQMEECIDTCQQGESRSVRMRALATWQPFLAATCPYGEPPDNVSDEMRVSDPHAEGNESENDVTVEVRLCGHVEPREQRLEGALFTPSLASQRMDFALTVLERCEAASVLDLGCGSGAFLETVAERATCVRRLAGADVSERALARARKAVRAKLEKRETAGAVAEDDVEIIGRSMLDLDERFVGWDLATCIEVVEHLDPEPLAGFGPAVLGRLRPKVLLVSTPNIEYNPLLQAAATGTRASNTTGTSACDATRTRAGDTTGTRAGDTTGTRASDAAGTRASDAAGTRASNAAGTRASDTTGTRASDANEGEEPCRLRNEDHRFEWTRAEFRSWAGALAAEYGYSVEFGGVGGEGAENGPGFCTQIALFRRILENGA